MFTSLDGFDEQFDLGADGDFYLRALLNGFSFTRLLGPSIAAFRLRRDQLSNTRTPELVTQMRLSVTRSLSPASFDDRLKLAFLRARNLPQYFIRILRRRCVGDQWFVPRTLDGDIN